MILSPVADEKLKMLNFKPLLKQSEIAKKNNWLDSTILQIIIIVRWLNIAIIVDYFMEGCKDLFLHKIFCGSKLLLKNKFSVDARYFRHKIFLWHLFCFIHKQHE